MYSSYAISVYDHETVLHHEAIFTKPGILTILHIQILLHIVSAYCLSISFDIFKYFILVFLKLEILHTCLFLHDQSGLCMHNFVRINHTSMNFEFMVLYHHESYTITFPIRTIKYICWWFSLLVYSHKFCMPLPLPPQDLVHMPSTVWSGKVELKKNPEIWLRYSSSPCKIILLPYQYLAEPSVRTIYLSPYYRIYRNRIAYFLRGALPKKCNFLVPQF